jgi:hypothetical protein
LRPVRAKAFLKRILRMKTREEYIALISKTFFSHENTKEIPLKTCRKEKYFLFLQADKF